MRGIEVIQCIVPFYIHVGVVAFFNVAFHILNMISTACSLYIKMLICLNFHHYCMDPPLCRDRSEVMLVGYKQIASL